MNILTWSQYKCRWLFRLRSIIQLVFHRVWVTVHCSSLVKLFLQCSLFGVFCIQPKYWVFIACNKNSIFWLLRFLFCQVVCVSAFDKVLCWIFWDDDIWNNFHECRNKIKLIYQNYMNVAKQLPKKFKPQSKWYFTFSWYGLFMFGDYYI